MQTPHILIVEDELVTRNTLKSIFEAEGYIVHEANDGAEMHNILSENDINLVIMDINLPGKNGLLLARELREQASVALMFLTGRDNEVDKILGLEIGADDYITKPFSVGELLARMRVSLRRAAHAGDEPIIVCGNLSIDLAQRRVLVENQEIKLTPTEYEIMKILAQNSGKVLTHRQLLKAVWGDTYSDDTHYIRVYIGQLRRKIEPNPTQPHYIITESGVGYRLMSK